MAQRFFHKVEPRVSIVLANGTPWKNWVMIDNHNGVIAPQSEFLSDSLWQCVQRGVGGVTSITKAEYDEWLKKKLTVLPRVWRDEWQPKRVLPSTDGQPGSPSTPSPSGEAPVVVVSQAMRPTADE